MRKLFALAVVAFMTLPQLAFAAGGGGSAVVIVADTRKTIGWEAWFANLYNDSHLYFTILTVVAIPLIGVCFGVAADFIMHHIGLDLKSRDLAEH